MSAQGLGAPASCCKPRLKLSTPATYPERPTSSVAHANWDGSRAPPTGAPPAPPRLETRQQC
eukprot:4719614-Pyramimonas_sp.AAC.1